MVVDDTRDDGAHVVGDLGIDRHDRVHVGVGLDARVERHARRIFKIVRRHEAEQAPAQLQRLFVILRDQVHHAGRSSSATAGRPVPRRSHLRR